MPLNEYDALLSGSEGAPANEYDQIMLDGAQQQKLELDSAKFVASKRDPKRWAQIVDISKRTKLPTDVVDRNFEAVSAADKKQSADQEYDRLISDTPGLSKWLTNPDNATLGRDEIAALARVDRGSRVIAQRNESGIDYAPTIGAHDLTAAAGTFAAVFGVGDPDRVAQSVADANRRARDLRAVQPDYVKEFGTAMEAHGHDLNKAVDAFLASQEDTGRSEIRKALDSFRTGAVTVGDALSMIGAAARRPRGLAYQILEGFPTSVPLLLGGVVGGAVGNAPGIVGGSLIGGMLPSVGAEINGELEKHGVDVTDANALAAAYKDPALMEGLRRKAARKGVTISMVNAILAPLGGKILETAEKAGAGAVGKAAATAADVSVQAGGVGAGDVAGQKAAGEDVNVGAALQSAIATLGYALGQEGIGASRRGLFHENPAKAAVQASDQATEALRATRDAQALGEIGTAVSEAATTRQVPESMKSLVELATGSDENAQVYFQAKDWDEHFQAAGGSPAKAVEDITGDSKAYYDAKATGAPIAIPLSDYVARVAPTEHWGKLLPFARTKPDGMSLHEASEYLASLPKTMEEIANEESQGVGKVEATGIEGSALRVRESVETQLKEAGVSPTVAKAQSALYEAAFRTLGERAGVDPLELFNRYNLKIKSENAPPPKPVPEVSLSAEEIAARSDIAGKAEGAIERDALSRPDPYLLADTERDAALKNDEGQFVYARAGAGQMRSNLSKVSTEGLIDEYGRLYKAQSEDQNRVVPTVNEDENLHSNSLGRPYVGLKGDAVNAKGRIKQRAKSIEKIEAELKARGIEDMGSLISDSFEFFQSAAAGGAESLNPLKADALQSYRDLVRQLEAFPEERRKLLASALKLPPDILHLKQDERGRIVFDSDRKVTIELLKKADRSTFLHETGHLYLEILSDLAKAQDASPGIVGDAAVIRSWLNADESGSFTRAQHEQFARGFEAYLLEGKAPSSELRDAFYRFKRWLLAIYKNLSGLGVELTPEVRKVFDRLLAVDSEIAAAEEAAKAQPLFADPRAVGMNDAQAESYQRAVDDAHQAAEEALTVRMMKQIKREESAEWKAWRDPIEAAVTSEVNKRPEYRALAFLKDEANPDGTPLDPSTPTFKLSREAVTETYGEEAAKALPRGVTGKGGLHPDLVAEVFGYGSGRELIEAISKAPKKEALIKSTTDARMQLEHGDRLSDFQVRDLAAQAIQNEKRAVVLRKQAEFLASEHYAQFAGLAKKVTRLVPPSAEIKAQADRIISSKPVRELRPSVYEAALRKLSKDAQDAFFAGDVQKAFDLNVKQLLTNEVMRAAADAKESVEKALDGFRKFYRPDGKLAKSRDMDLVNAGRAVLATFGIGRAEKPAAAYLEQIRRYDPEMGATVADLVNSAIENAPRFGDYRSMSFGDFQALTESVGALWSQSRRTQQVEIDGVKVDRHAAQEEMAARIAEIPTKPVEKAGYARAVTKWEKTQRNLMSARSWLRRVEHWVDAMDGGNPDGPFRRFIWNPVSEGATAYRVAKRGAIEAYLDVVNPIEKGMKSGTIEAKELGYTFENKAELLGALLHRGNESNQSKLLRGRGWGLVDEAGVLDRSRWDAFESRMWKEAVLTKADYDFVQGVWDIFERQKPEAQRAHKEMYGHYFAEVTASPFKTPFGDYRGGYYPAKVDPFMVPDAQIHREAELLTSGADNSFMFPTTGRGFTKTRVEEYAKPLIMNAAYVPMHLDAVLRFTHIEPRVKDVGRMVVSPSFRSVLDGFDPTVAGEMLVPWLQRAAAQRVDLPGKFPAIDRFWKEVRNRTGLQIMTANVLNALQQYTGISISAAQVEPGRLGNALWQYVRDPKGTAAAVSEKSDFMKTRMTAGVVEMQKRIDDIMLDPSKYEKAREFAKEHGYFLAAGTQHTVDVITWMGKYDEAIARGVSDHEAVREANSAVRETQGSFAPEDISRVEAQTPFVRAFMQFYGYFNMQANLLGTEFLNTIRSMGLRKGAGRLVFLYTTAMVIPAVLADAIMRVGSGKPFDDDDDGPADEVFGLLFGSQVRTATRFIPIAGPAVDAAIGAFTKSTGDDDVRTSPAVTTVERAVHAPADVYRAIKEKTIRNKDILDVLTAIGMATGIPTAPLARPINYIRDVRSGKAHPKNVLDFARGVVVGR